LKTSNVGIVAVAALLVVAGIGFGIAQANRAGIEQANRAGMVLTAESP